MEVYNLNDSSEREYKKILSTAFKLLSIRDYTEKEMYIRLCRKKFNKDMIKSVLKELIIKGYINDEQYAEKWINNIAYSKYIGSNGIKHILLKKGISYDIIAEKLNNYNEYEAALLAAKKKEKQISYKGFKKNETKQILGRFLQRKGFTYDVIFRVLDEHDI
ncbi:MAG TPA: regulatory protein RecX [Thermoanaerobacterales bacterium]|nr:regulatory protein RecX [Thermoanaerobacterales bacterium]